MSTTVSDLSEWVDKQVILHLKKEDGSLEEVEGLVEAASEAGMAFKRKGKGGLALIMPDEIEEIQAAPEKPKALTVKKMQPIKEGQARQHLLTYHGVPLDWAKGTDEKAAFQYHLELDHSNLGHKHVEKTETERDKALAEGDEQNAGEGDES